MTHAHDIYLCRECGSPRVQVTAWVSCNRDAVLGDDAPIEGAYCPACEANPCGIAVVTLLWDPRPVPEDLSLPLSI